VGMAGAAAGLSMASAGLSAYGTIEKGKGEQAADEYKAESLERAANFGRTKAAQTGAQYTEQLNNTLGNIDAIRAAAHADPSSPTGAAIRDTAEYQGDRQKSITVDNILEQADQDTADAAYLRSAGKYALMTSDISAAAGVLGAGGSSLFNLSKPPPGGG
jgi:hypothetical protein